MPTLELLANEAFILLVLILSVFVVEKASHGKHSKVGMKQKNRRFAKLFGRVQKRDAHYPKLTRESEQSILFQSVLPDFSVYIREEVGLREQLEFLALGAAGASW